VIALITSLISLGFSLLTCLLAFLIIPIYLFPIISIANSAIACVLVDSSNPKLKLLLKALTVLLMAIAVAVFLFWHRILAHEAWH